MIKARCRTNLDDYNGNSFARKAVEWPEVFQALPRVGDSVEGKCGKKLRVVQVTHRYDGSIEVELHR